MRAFKTTTLNSGVVRIAVTVPQEGVFGHGAESIRTAIAVVTATTITMATGTAKIYFVPASIATTAVSL